MNKSTSFPKSCIIFIALAIICVFTSCNAPNNNRNLRICLDVPKKCGSEPTNIVFERFLSTVAENGGPVDVEVEYIPQENGEKRESTLTRLRTEIMARTGPDLFIITTTPNRESIFPYPEKSMINQLFLPLDDYIEDSQFAQWESFSAQIMGAGQTNGKQFLIPLSCTFPITCYRKADCTVSIPTDSTWDEIVSGDNLYIKNAQSLFGIGENKLSGIGGLNFDGVLGELADYKSEELAFSQEELAKYVKTVLSLSDLDDAGEFSCLPDFFQSYATNGFWEDGSGINKLRPIRGDEPMVMVPQYNRMGGVTATVFDYACINANTKKGEDAFFIIDMLLSSDVQQYSDLVSSLFFTSYGAPVNDDLMQNSFPVKNVYDTSLTEENFMEYCQLRERVDSVNFYGKVNLYLDNLMLECWDINAGNKQGNIDELIAETYRIMCMDLAES